MSMVEQENTLPNTENTVGSSKKDAVNVWMIALPLFKENWKRSQTNGKMTLFLDKCC